MKIYGVFKIDSEYKNTFFEEETLNIQMEIKNCHVDIDLPFLLMSALDPWVHGGKDG